MTSNLAAQHQSDQQQLTGLLAVQIARMVTPQPSSAGVGELLDELTALVTQYNRASAALAADYYDAERDEAGIRRRFTVPVADTPPVEQLRRSMGWATRDLADDYVDLDAVLARVDGAAVRAALAGGRDTLVEATEADPQARGYARIPRPDACAFCAMLGLRIFGKNGRIQGVYQSEQTALFKGGSDDKYHDYCRCTAQVIFNGQDYEPPAHVRAWDNLYRDSTGSVGGNKKLAAFRAALVEQRRDPLTPAVR